MQCFIDAAVPCKARAFDGGGFGIARFLKKG